jgi:hypothetical protein
MFTVHEPYQRQQKHEGQNPNQETVIDQMTLFEEQAPSKPVPIIIPFSSRFDFKTHPSASYEL